MTDLDAAALRETSNMRETRITLPDLALIAGTRAALGAGLGLLLADRLSANQRRAVGWTLVLIGAISTVPLAVEVLGKSRASGSLGWVKRDRELSRS
jgi:hypothetical protein